MTRLRPTAICIALALCSTSSAWAVCDNTDSLLDRTCQHVTDTWEQGGNDLYIPFHTYHLRSAYTSEKIDSFREDNWGLGYGRSRYNASGNWEGLYAMAFLDSHSNVEPMVGYGYQWIAGQPQALHAGVGYSVLVTAREDIGHYTPIPGVLPIASVGYRDVSLNTAFVPGGKGHGNVFFFWSTFGF
ncbi:lipid IVA palmitoyltransferase [Novimethylophilus kurashikiensis]|uniref:Lipid IVA palmitoyltransferase n=1 Tax=Novimethylophilus kurashikiensis TaxID=1825523 RepID=A0A2R5F7Y7_9PROT|nr:lipid IV(A) palmitoyltransferase PagP [Novimethylophilus kurashikiensis]GBG12744.1 lipid IVA palmitoyltransferase [Novimethylophilus kurashikiensis]